MKPGFFSRMTQSFVYVLHLQKYNIITLYVCKEMNGTMATIIEKKDEWNRGMSKFEKKEKCMKDLVKWYNFGGGVGGRGTDKDFNGSCNYTLVHSVTTMWCREGTAVQLILALQTNCQVKRNYHT